MTGKPMTQSDIGIVEMLTKPDAWSAHFHGFGSYTEVEESAPFEAAALITEMVEALEEAKRCIADAEVEFDCHYASLKTIRALLAKVRSK